MRLSLWALILTAFARQVAACIWDSDTLSDEKRHSPTLADAILAPGSQHEDVKTLNERIQRLLAVRKEDDPTWWSELAGAHLRLGQPAEAVKILDPLTNRFPQDYAIHANLGTAYHLLGRYSEAEREIARDLEINPDAHFGLEKYHLALLQYLIRDENYRLRHVYVDEFTSAFLTENGMYVPRLGGRAESTAVMTAPPDKEQTAAALRTELRDRKTLSKDELYKIGKQLEELTWSDELPSYRTKWDLAGDTNLAKGVIYMASLNGQEPACWTMLGMLAVQRHDKHLTIAAFQKAIGLGSPQTPILQAEVDVLKEHIRKARANSPASLIMPFLVFCSLVIALYMVVRTRVSRTRANRM